MEALWTELDSEVSQTQPQKGNFQDFKLVRAQTAVHSHTHMELRKQSTSTKGICLLVCDVGYVVWTGN